MSVRAAARQTCLFGQRHKNSATAGKIYMFKLVKQIINPTLINPSLVMSGGDHACLWLSGTQPEGLEMMILAESGFRMQLNQDPGLERSGGSAASNCAMCVCVWDRCSIVSWRSTPDKVPTNAGGQTWVSSWLAAVRRLSRQHLICKHCKVSYLYISCIFWLFCWVVSVLLLCKDLFSKPCKENLHLVF